MVLSLAGTTSALAIPSPELVVGSLTSISQLIALGSALLGGGAAAAALRSRSRGGAPRNTRFLMGLAGGLFVVLLGSIAFNIYQYVEQKNEHRARLEETLLRPSRAPAGLAENPDAKELTLGEQLRHPLRVSTANAEKLLNEMNSAKRNDVIFLDVREAAEQAMGTLRGAMTVRFPDLPAKNIDFTGKKAIVFCHNGDRSSEVCEALAKQGIDCQFIAGGLEKWVVENRPMQGLAARSLEDLRAIPPYKNKNTLLGTDEARRLVGEEKAIFLDVRPPDDFAAQHIDGAINLNLRRMPTPELNRRIAELPRRPVILPCYDRRGCFFAEALGYELTQAGHDVRGRYTVPWEYFVKRPRPPHIETRIAEHNQSVWVKGGNWLAGVLKFISTWTGLVFAIVMLAFVSRLLVLPFSLKAERDQIRSRAATDEMKELKARYENDPVARSRAIRAFYKRHGLTPMRNLVALAFLPVMGVALIAVETLSKNEGGRFLWISNFAHPDTTLVLPVIFAALIALYLDLAFVRTMIQRVLTWAIALPLLTATGALFTAGSDIYLVTTAALLLVQRTLVSGALGRLAVAWRRWRLGEGIVPLSDPERLVNCGNKAYRLARMRQEGMPVPDGVVLTAEFLARFASASADRQRAHLDRIWRAVNAERLVVRSSAASEDGAHHSFAGVFESVLNVDRGSLQAAVEKVCASFDDPRVKSYGVERGGGSIVVQRMVDAEHAGVLFTEDPAAGGLSMIEMVEGTAEGLVSGAVAPKSFRCGRLSGEVIGGETPPMDLTPLIRLGRRAEQIFGAAQDIEWTYRDGQYYLVQSRNITRLLEDAGGKASLRTEYARVLNRAVGAEPDAIVFAQNELAEMLPRPTPLSFSLMEAMWENGGSVDVACRMLGIRYGVEEDAPGYLLTIFGRLYVDKQQERIRAGQISGLAARRLIKRAEKIEREFRETFLPGYSREIALHEAVDFDRLATPDLIDALKQLHDDFVYGTHVEVDVINVAASFYFERAKRLLAECGLEATAHLAHVPETDYDRILEDAGALQGDARRDFLIAKAGHRAVLDYELASPRYAEVPDPIEALCEAEAQKPQAANDDAAHDRALTQAGRRVQEAAQIACRFERLKEDAKHHSLRQLAVIRRAVLALDRRFGLDGLSFYLTMPELLSVQERPLEATREMANARCQLSLQFAEAPPLPPTLSIRELEKASAGIDEHKEAGGEIRGTRVSGAGMVTGRARVISALDAESGRPIHDLADGEIVVSPMVHPAWLPYFGRARGFVCAVGGWLSHTAILAREHNLVMIVGARGLDAIANGDELRLHLDGTVEIIKDAEEVQELPRSLAAE